MLLVSARPKIQAVCAGFKEALGDAEAASLLTARPAMHRIAVDHFQSNIRWGGGSHGLEDIPGLNRAQERPGLRISWRGSWIDAVIGGAYEQCQAGCPENCVI